METPCAVADYKDGKLEVWAPAQVPQWARGALAQALKLKGGDVKVNVTLLGGGFGRKGKPDFIVEAGLASKECGYPVKLLWTREDDVQHDFYHACCAQHFEIGLDKQKQVTGWLQRAAYPSIGGTSNPNARQPAPFEVAQGMVDLPYNIENLCQETNPAQAKTRIGWVRSVININNAFSIGSALDELAYARGVDPVKNLLELLGDDRQIDFASKVNKFWNYNEKPGNYPFKTARLRNVIETVAKNANWGKKLPNGYGRGIAAHRSFLTYVACVVEVFVKDGEVKIPNVYYAVDCGVAVNPDRIKAQFEGGAVFGTSLALFNEITMKQGAVQQSNFHDLKMTRMNQGPQNISVHIVESDEKPTGVGEPPVPPFAPALCNAIFAATGKRHRSLPVRL